MNFNGLVYYKNNVVNYLTKPQKSIQKAKSILGNINREEPRLPGIETPFNLTEMITVRIKAEKGTWFPAKKGEFYWPIASGKLPWKLDLWVEFFVDDEHEN
eukprot:Sdes_comp19019_c0_seq1m9568